MNTRNGECANTCRACHWTPEAKVFYPAGNTTNRLFHMFREKWKNSTYWRHDLGFCKPLQVFLHQLFPLTKLISFYKTFISLQTLVRQNWYLILRQRYIWYCIVLHRLHTNNTSKNHSNVEWSKTIQNLAISWVNLFLEFHHSESFPSIFKALPSGLSCFHCTIQSFYFLF